MLGKVVQKKKRFSTGSLVSLEGVKGGLSIELVYGWSMRAGGQSMCGRRDASCASELIVTTETSGRGGRDMHELVVWKGVA